MDADGWSTSPPDVQDIDDFSFENPKNRSDGEWTWKHLIQLQRLDRDFVRVESLFQQGWKHAHKGRKYVHRIYKVIWPDYMIEPYLVYRTQVASECVRTAQQGFGNEQLLFHGTTRSCLLGKRDDSITLCNLPECSLCSILRDSFEVSRCGSKHALRRFGTGIYTTACSSKADDYVTNKDLTARLRVMVVGRVAVGLPYTCRRSNVHLTKPPHGYHSIYGIPGGDLNYEETVIYDDAAIRPAYLIVYGDKPVF